MTISIRVKRIIAAVFFTGVLAADAFQIGAVATDQEVSQAMIFPKAYMGRKIFNPDSTFEGV